MKEMYKLTVVLALCVGTFSASLAAQDLNVPGNIQAAGGIATNGYTSNGTDVITWSAQVHGALSVGGGYAPLAGDIGASHNLYVNGNVGIGTTSPTVWDSAYHTIDYAGYGVIYGASNGSGWTGQSYGQAGWHQNSRFSGGISYAVGTGGASYLIQSAGQLEFGNAASVSAGSAQTFSSRLDILPNGNVGIGTTAPGAKLEVAGNLKLSAGTGASITFSDNTVQSTAWTGTLCGGDYAESVNVTGLASDYEPGDVLVISGKTGTDVAKSTRSYSRLVGGIYSTKPGLIGRRQAGERTEREIPMAMVGIVPTKVNTENGPIERGDLLVTSSTAGYAMKGTDPTRLIGAVIGKALGDLESGAGMVEVLVSLQ